jgi:hypothetical protein
MRIFVDTDEAKLKDAGERLKGRANLMQDLAQDPAKVLAELGIEVDEDTAKRIQSHASNRTDSKLQAAILHVDV